MALDQVQGLMQFAFGAMAAGFSALCGTLRKGAAQEPLGGSQLRNPRPEITLGCGEFGTAGGVGHDLYIKNIQDNKESTEQKYNTNLPQGPLRAKTTLESNGLAGENYSLRNR